MFELNGKIAIVTGGNGVLGGAIAHGLSKNGAKVAVLGRTEETVEHRVKEIKDKGGEALAVVADVLNKESLMAAKDKILDKWGSIDILVNGAGGNKKGAVITPDQEFFDLSLEALDGVNQLNFNGTVLPTLVFAKEMVKQKKGSVINISSMAAQKTITRVMGYSASKAAIDNFTKWLAVELNHKYGEGLRVNAIAPGFFVGEQNRDLLLNQDGSLTSRGQKIVDNTPMARFGEPEELQGAAVWLASDASAFVTGIVIPVDGGFSAFGGI
ncbi:short-chain dehydrogenase/reductase SDR HrmU [Zunongwangia profunda SM-A87]|uniref:Short-chain dehydrogenase/reductase SDR HrmU n=1 Tax=Zunongwangia profunda (strain DSM 18752 / CCTCC AB 206139 / SM-A87) TaxID=655815 RepID=D5BGV6_ZUNPS|nr:SDR family oxidoreductase [Zunongwangia profunda]ADF53287.1 short-chain dehydrogenase/reductase SDR HrmU [Zunongwangia profunda SM-A87]